MMDNYRLNLQKYSYFFLGLSSTMTIISIGGMSLFYWGIIIVLVDLAISRRITLRLDDVILYWIATLIISCVIGLTVTKLPSGFQRASITGTVALLLIGIIYLSSDSKDSVKALFQGFSLSCKIQLFWCILQFVLYQGAGVDLNYLLFDRVLRMNTGGITVNEGNAIITGLATHRGNLTFVLLWLFCSNDSYLIRATIVGVAVLSRNTTAVVGLIICIMLLLFIRIKSNKAGTIKRLLEVLVLIICIGAMFIVLKTQIMQYVDVFFMKFSDVFSNKYDNSSVVHANYYRKLIYILKNESIIQFIFGSGTGTSGYFYSKWINQYTWMDSWVVESDYINVILNVGIVGLMAEYAIILRDIRIFKQQKYNRYIALLLATLVAGVFYNVLFTWVLMIILWMKYFVKYSVLLKGGEIEK